ncbi:universal stress protein [Roseivirga sp.]|uniref:universal stress protein n=1 Tax=Roseivirga sp. TaxID=1964215 RepID=UPI003B51F6C5
MKLKNILVPLDFSRCSDNALSYAIELAQKCNGRLTLLHCYSLQMPAAEMTVDIHPELVKEYQQTAERNFSHLKQTTPALEKVAYDEIIEISFVRDGILEMAAKTEADLIVMGTKGADNRLDDFFGTNTYHTVRKAKVPVLAIPEEVRFKPYKKILFASDFKHVEDMNQLEVVRILATYYHAEVQILHVGEGWGELNEHKNKETAAIVSYFGTMEHSYHFVEEKTEVGRAIERHLKEHENELLVLIARKHYFPGSLFRKGLTREIVLHKELPILALPELL